MYCMNKRGHTNMPTLVLKPFAYCKYMGARAQGHKGTRAHLPASCSSPGTIDTCIELTPNATRASSAKSTPPGCAILRLSLSRGVTRPRPVELWMLSRPSSNAKRVHAALTSLLCVERRSGEEEV